MLPSRHLLLIDPYTVTYGDATSWSAVVQPGATYLVSDGVTTQTVTVPTSGTVAGEADAHAGATATLKVGVGLAGAAAGHAGTQASPTGQVPLSGAAAGQAGAVGTVSRTDKLTGQAAGRAGGQATPSTNAAEGGGASGSGAATGTLSVSVPLVGQAGGQASDVAGLGIPDGTTGRVIRVVGDQGTALLVVLPFAWELTGDQGHAIGIGVAPTGYYGDASLTVGLAGVAAGGAGAVATGPQMAIPLAGTATGQAGGGLTLPQQIGLAGTAAGKAQAKAIPYRDNYLEIPLVTIEWQDVSSRGYTKWAGAVALVTFVGSTGIVHMYFPRNDPYRALYGVLPMTLPGSL